jgi:hypothetical protein
MAEPFGMDLVPPKVVRRTAKRGAEPESVVKPVRVAGKTAVYFGFFTRVVAAPGVIFRFASLRYHLTVT